MEAVGGVVRGGPVAADKDLHDPVAVEIRGVRRGVEQRFAVPAAGLAAILHGDPGMFVAICLAAGNAERERFQLAVAVKIHLHGRAVAQRIPGKRVSRLRGGRKRQKGDQQAYAQCFHRHHLGFQTAGMGKKFQRQKKCAGGNGAVRAG